MVKLNETERRIYNDQLDLYVEMVQQISKELENSSEIKEVSEIQSKFEKSVNLIAQRLSAGFESEAEARVFEKFLQLRFGLSVKKIEGKI